MKKLKASTWVLIAVVIAAGALGTTLWFARPAGFPGWHDREKAAEWMEQRWKERLGDVPPEELEELKEKFGEGPFFRHFRGGWRGHHFGGFRGGNFGRGRWGFPLIGILVIGGVTGLVIVTVKNRQHRHSTGEKSALEELEEQFALGKIDEREFQRRRAVLREESREAQS
jgi:uncharacterized membrane protein